MSHPEFWDGFFLINITTSTLILAKYCLQRLFQIHRSLSVGTEPLLFYKKHLNFMFIIILLDILHKKERKV